MPEEEASFIMAEERGCSRCADLRKQNDGLREYIRKLKETLANANAVFTADCDGLQEIIRQKDVEIARLTEDRTSYRIGREP